MAEISARGIICTKRKSNTYIMEDKEMSTEVIGYLARPQRTAQNPTEHTQTKRSIMDIQIPDTIMQKLLGVIMMELGALTLPICDGDGTAFVMIVLLGIAMLIGGKRK